MPGTHAITVTWYSRKLSTTWRSPSQNTVLAPLYKEKRKPTVHSNTWWIGKMERSVSLELTSKTLPISIKFAQIFLWDSATTLELEVVPEVKSIMLIFSASILASKNSRLPASINTFPASMSSLSE